MTDLQRSISGSPRFTRLIFADRAAMIGEIAHCAGIPGHGANLTPPCRFLATLRQNRFKPFESR
jgi:hypothetical protein